jgi:DNA-binding transcriptional LysR family regulator
MDWDDLRYVLAISRSGGLNGAARYLGVNSSSVFRRLGALEKQLEVRLFERLRTGYRLTTAGEAFAKAAERMEQELLQVERKVKGTDTRLEGHVRLSTSDAVAQHLLPRWLGEFRETYPGLTLDVAATVQNIDLSKRDVDVVIRVTSSPPEHLIGRRLGRVAYAAYASKRYLDRVGRGRPLEAYHWLGWDGAMNITAMGLWLSKAVPETSIHMRFDQFAPARFAVNADLGCCSMPCFACDSDAALERIPHTHVLSNAELWVLTHPDLRRSARVRAFLQFFGTRLAAIAAELAGSEDAVAA